jgi:hypothetical protein
MMILALVALDRRQRREDEPAGQFVDDVAIEVSTTTGRQMDNNTTKASLKRLKNLGLVKNGDPRKHWEDLWLPTVKGEKVLEALYMMGLPKEVQ